MTHLTPERVAEALKAGICRHVPQGHKGRLSIEPTQNLLELVDSFGFADLVMELETELDVELPLDQVDLASIVHADRLINFICQNG